jgi:peptidoglycan/LPS O-acetylase OafA/YrhL
VGGARQAFERQDAVPNRGDRGGALAAYAIWLGSLDTSNGWWHFEGGFFRAGFSFFAGIMVYRIWQIRPALTNIPAIVPGAAFLALLIIPMPAHIEAAYEAGLVLLAFPLLIWLGASSTPAPQVTVACVWLGEISYAVYVLHVPIIAGIVRHHVPDAAPRGLVLLVAIVAAADLTTRFFDRPVRRYFMACLGLNSAGR